MSYWQYYYPKCTPPAYRWPNIPLWPNDQPSYVYQFPPQIPNPTYSPTTLAAIGPYAQFAPYGNPYAPLMPYNPIQGRYGTCDVTMKQYGKSGGNNCQIGYRPTVTADGQCMCCSDTFGDCGSDV